MALAERVVRGLKASLVAQAVYALSNAALVVVLTRYLLTPREYGLLHLALSVLGVVAILGTLGVPKSAGRYVTEYMETDPGQVPYVLRRSLAAVLGFTALVGVGLVAASRPLAGLVGEADLVPFLLVGVGYVVARSLSQYLRLAFQGFNRVDYSAALRVVSSVGRVAFAVGFVLLGLGALGAFLGYVAGFAAAAALGFGLLYVRFYADLDAADDAEEGLSRRLLEYSVPLTATRGANVIDKRVDVVLVGAILNATAVSYYTIAKQVANFATVPATALGFTLSPTYGEQKAGGGDGRAGRLYQTALRHVLLLYVPAGTGLVVVAGPLVRLVFGEGYLGAVPVVRAFGVFVVVDAVNRITSDGLDYLGLARNRAIAKGAMALANVVLNLALIPVLGVFGAALATLVTYSAYTAVNVRAIHGELDLRPGDVVRDAAAAVAVAAAMGVAVLAALPYVASLPALAGVVALGVGVWAVLAVGTGLLDVRRIAAALA